jgi:hypothetical protein
MHGVPFVRSLSDTASDPPVWLVCIGLCNAVGGQRVGAFIEVPSRQAVFEQGVGNVSFISFPFHLYEWLLTMFTG